MKISQLGEFGLIDQLARNNSSKRADTIVSIGDDAAAILLSDAKLKSISKYQLVTTDTLIENVHFKTNGFSYLKLGIKALAVNISDIAAMGGIPKHALVTIGVPKSFEVAWIKQLYRGLNQLRGKYQIDLIGGDTVLSPKGLIISIVLLGEVEPENMVLRSTAKPGDQICVTGEFGGPAAGKYANKVDLKIRLKEARVIAKNKVATAMIDSSDGLVRSIMEICKASQVGAMIFENQVPIAKGATLDQALYGGEEYELVFTIQKHRIDTLRKIGCKVTIVGEMVDSLSGIKTINARGKKKSLKSDGYDHFSKPEKNKHDKYDKKTTTN